MTKPSDRGEWISTFTGVKFYPRDPRSEEVRIIDVAHSLSHLCRFNGHCKYYYSVSEHSVLCSLIVPKEHALIALLHDAQEAYVADLSRPLKVMLPDYGLMEAAVWRAVAERFGLPLDLPPEVKEADDRMCVTEWELLMTPGQWTIPELSPAEVKIRCLLPNQAKELFLDRYHDVIRDL